MDQFPFNDRRPGVHQTRQRICASTVLLWIVTFLSTCENCHAQNTSSPQSILAHPSMFGAPWTGIVTVVVVKTTTDLCSETLESTENNIFFNLSTNELNDQYDTAIFYDDPYVDEWKGSCDYSQMAQAVETLYPSAKYLLISKDSLTAFQKLDDEPDTNLSLASVTMDDAKEIDSMLRNETGALITDGAILLTIDAYSRAYVDTCICRKDEEDLKRKRLWSTLLRVIAVVCQYLGRHISC
mmetsp:Transcript_30360/g.72783  ORF Transcript_30360/g.72783 Transcript_30360/m.72783 type:complete len:240 (-) Transcript_30360:1264-1983(-)